MNLLSHKHVVIRKKHRCDGCGRVFEIGTKMHRQVIAAEGRIYNWYTCPTCEELISISDDLDNGYGEYEQYCVAEYLNVGQTPEQMLEEVKARKKVSGTVNNSCVHPCV